jgi:hypothetical protein
MKLLKLVKASETPGLVALAGFASAFVMADDSSP